MTEPQQLPADVTVPSEVAEQIASALGEDSALTSTQVNQVLAAWNHVRSGDALGTVRRDDDSGKVAHRVDAAGVHQWRVSGIDGEQYNDLQPTLPWPVIYEP